MGFITSSIQLCKQNDGVSIIKKEKKRLVWITVKSLQDLHIVATTEPQKRGLLLFVFLLITSFFFPHRMS